MIEDNRKPLSRLQIWMLASRPKTLPAAASPVIVGSAIAFQDGKFQLLPALATLLAALLLQIGANISNDYYDFRKGADTVHRLGPLRVTSAGLLKPGEVYQGMWVVFGLAAALGIYLAFVGGWPVVVMGVAAIAGAILYTAGPISYGYKGLGELFVFIFFGLVAGCGTYFIQAGRVTPAAVWSSIPMGLLITAILVVNNLRDIDTDRQAGKKTLAVRLGAGGAQAEYLLCLAGAYLTPALMGMTGIASFYVLLSWLSIPMAVSLSQKVLRLKGRSLNEVLAGTGQLTLFYGLLFSAGIVLARLAG